MFDKIHNLLWLLLFLLHIAVVFTGIFLVKQWRELYRHVTNCHLFFRVGFFFYFDIFCFLSFRFFATLLTLFWSLFGMADQTDPNIKDEFKSRGNDYGFTSGVGTVMFAIYHIVMSLVMLNMLIAMMSNSFQEIEVSVVDSDVSVTWYMTIGI